jgi:hypothetical protein
LVEWLIRLTLAFQKKKKEAFQLSRPFGIKKANLKTPVGIWKEKKGLQQEKEKR